MGLAVAVLAIVVLPWKFWARQMGEFLVRDEPPAPAGMIVVLAGDPSGNRILKAAELVKQGYAPKALVSGPSGDYGEAESDLAIRFAVRHGYPAAYFVPLPNESHSTMEEARTIGAKLREWKIDRVDVVTSNYHTRRAAEDYRRAGTGVDFRMVAAPDVFFTPDGWWRNREGRKTFLMEWMKTIASWLRL